MQDRLIELIHESDLSLDSVRLTDHLLANGVIVLPCKVGDKVYRTSGNYCGEKIFEGVVNQINIYNNGEIRFWMYGHPLGFVCDDIGKTVFLSREEAEKVLVKMKGGAMMDRYDFASVVDDIFKECNSVEEVCNRYVQLKKDLDNLFQQNIALKGGAE